MDDVVIKSQKAGSVSDDLKETFANLRRYNMKLNPTKCVFGVPAGKLLGFIVSERGIEANPEKIKAIQNLKKPVGLKDVQKITGCIAALSRFIARLGEKAIPLYRLLKKLDKFVWDQEADDALELLKKTLTEAPVLAAPQPKEPMLLYIAAGPRAVSVVAVVERTVEAKEYSVQRPVYYVVKFSQKQNNVTHIGRS